MARKKDNLTKTIHLRVSPTTKSNLEEIAVTLGLPCADIERLALAVFIWLWQKLSDINFLKQWLLSFIEKKDN